MENLFIQAAALELRDTPFPARFFIPSAGNRSRCMAIIDLGGTNLSDDYQGVLDNYLECGQDVAISFQPAPRGIRGSTKSRKLDKPVWPARLAAAPSHFQSRMPHNSLCLVFFVTEFNPPPVDLADVGTYKKYDGSLKPYTVYLRLEDTSKAARRNFNGIARLCPPPPADTDDEWVRDGDSEADLTGVHPLPNVEAPRGQLLLPPSEAQTALVQPIASTGRGADTFRSVLCGMAANDYFEYDLLSGVEAGTRERLLEAIHPTRRGPRTNYLSRIPCRILLIHGPPGCGKSVQLAGNIALSITQC